MKCDKIIEKVNILLWKRINFCTDKKKKKKVKDWLKGIKGIISTLHKTKQKFCRVSSWEEETWLQRKMVKLPRNGQFPFCNKDEGWLEQSWNKLISISQDEVKRKSLVVVSDGNGEERKFIQKDYSSKPQPHFQLSAKPLLPRSKQLWAVRFSFSISKCYGNMLIKHAASFFPIQTVSLFSAFQKSSIWPHSQRFNDANLHFLLL